MNSLKIGKIEIKGKTALAPLAGVSDVPFRLECKEQGANVVFSEMVSSEGLVRGSEKTNRYLKFMEAERPVALQLFGGNPETMGKAAKLIEEKNPDFIDINFGCPVKKIVKNLAGSALLKDPPQMGRIVNSMVKSSSLPVTAKIRCGWDENSMPVSEIGKILEDNGASAITIHARTRKQAFEGKANWNEIRKLKDAVSIPVIGNGDVRTPQDAIKMINETGCDLVMIGRGAMGNPWIFNQIEHYMKTGEALSNVSYEEILRVCIRQFATSVDMYGEHYAKHTMKKHIAWYLKGLPENARIKNLIFKSDSAEKILEILYEYISYIKNSYDPESEVELENKLLNQA